MHSIKFSTATVSASTLDLAGILRIASLCLRALVVLLLQRSKMATSAGKDERQNYTQLNDTIKCIANNALYHS